MTEVWKNNNKASHLQQKRRLTWKPSRRRREVTVRKILIITTPPLIFLLYSDALKLSSWYILLCRQASFWHQFPKPHRTCDKALWTIFHLIHYYNNTGCRLFHPLLLMMPGIMLGRQDNVVQGFLEKITVIIIWQFPKSTALKKKHMMKQLRKIHSFSLFIPLPTSTLL